MNKVYIRVGSPLISIHRALATTRPRIKHLLNVSCRLKLARYYLLTLPSLTRVGRNLPQDPGVSNSHSTQELPS